MNDAEAGCYSCCHLFVSVCGDHYCWVELGNCVVGSFATGTIRRSFQLTRSIVAALVRSRNQKGNNGPYIYVWI